MCFGGNQPKNPTTSPSYKAEDASDYFTVTMKDRDGDEKQLSERNEKANEKATFRET